MPEDSADVTEVEFISAQQDADLRLACFQSVRDNQVTTFNAQLAAAKALYAWTMGDSDEERAEPGSQPLEDQCGRKH